MTDKRPKTGGKPKGWTSPEKKVMLAGQRVDAALLADFQALPGTPAEKFRQAIAEYVERHRNK